METKPVIDFIFELGQLGYTNRSGWERLRIKDPQNDAEHSMRVAQIAFILAKMEGHPDPHRVATMGLFHEIAEVRVGDLNAISKKYVHADEQRAVSDQTAPLGCIGDEIYFMWKECDDHRTPAGKIAKDADHLELMFTAKEYMAQGYRGANVYFDGAKSLLETESAKKLANELEKMDSHDWWRNLDLK